MADRFLRIILWSYFEYNLWYSQFMRSIRSELQINKLVESATWYLFDWNWPTCNFWLLMFCNRIQLICMHLLFCEGNKHKEAYSLSARKTFFKAKPMIRLLQYTTEKLRCQREMTSNIIFTMNETFILITFMVAFKQNNGGWEESDCNLLYVAMQ